MHRGTKVVRHFSVAGFVALAPVVLGACESVSGLGSLDGPMVRKPKSYTEIKYAVTVRQRLDFSCGGAAVATLLTHYWERPTAEIEVLDLLRSRYPGQDWRTLQDKGFSLDDLIWVSNRLGFEAQAASLP